MPGELRRGSERLRGEGVGGRGKGEGREEAGAWNLEIRALFWDFSTVVFGSLYIFNFKQCIVDLSIYYIAKETC